MHPQLLCLSACVLLLVVDDGGAIIIMRSGGGFFARTSGDERYVVLGLALCAQALDALVPMNVAWSAARMTVPRRLAGLALGVCAGVSLVAPDSGARAPVALLLFWGAWLAASYEEAASSPLEGRVRAHERREGAEEEGSNMSGVPRMLRFLVWCAGLATAWGGLLAWWYSYDGASASAAAGEASSAAAAAATADDDQLGAWANALLCVDLLTSALPRGAPARGAVALAVGGLLLLWARASASAEEEDVAARWTAGYYVLPGLWLSTAYGCFLGDSDVDNVSVDADADAHVDEAHKARPAAALSTTGTTATTGGTGTTGGATKNKKKEEELLAAFQAHAWRACVLVSAGVAGLCAAQDGQLRLALLATHAAARWFSRAND